MSLFHLLNITSVRQLYGLFFLFALLVAGTVTVIVYRSSYPYQLKIADQKFTDNRNFLLYHDFNHDGFSEQIEVGNNEQREKYSLVFLSHRQQDSHVIDQFNFHEPLKASWIFFGDYSGDGYDETFVFTQQGDSLYLSIIDVNLKRWLLDRHYLLSVRKPNPYHRWDVGKVIGHLLDVNDDGVAEVVFAVHSGFSHHPRGIFIFDVRKKKIINRFLSNAGINDLLVYDLTGDQKPEIILLGAATGNIDDRNHYTDHKSWFLVFDRQLNFVFPPRSFGEYPSRIHGEPLEISGESYLLVTYIYAGDKSFNDYLCLINSRGVMIRRQFFAGWDLLPTRVNREWYRPWLYSGTRDGKVARLNPDLLVQKTVQLRVKDFRMLDVFDLNQDGKAEIVGADSKGLLLLNNDLNPIARLSVNGRIRYHYSRRFNGPGQPVEFVVHDRKNCYRFALQRNRIYAWLPVLFLGMSGIVFGLILLGHRLMTIFNIYFTYLLFSLRKSRHGILILDHKGLAFYFNTRIQELLHLSEPIFKGKHVEDILRERPQVLECIRRGMTSGKLCQCEINFVDPDQQFKGEIIITPFRTTFNYIYAYLIEIHDHTQPILNDRLQVWSRSVQKMVHDIKQPLSSVSLNLKALQMRLEQMEIENREDIRDDLLMMKNELEKVRQITNNFLKFVNLENPHFQWVDLEQTIRHSLERFSSLLNDGLQIELEFDAEVKTIWADPQQLELVLHTLVENAIDAMQGRGHIRVSTLLGRQLDDHFSRMVQIEIADNGPGIDPAIKDKIFEPFFTTKTDGTGMGLAIAKKIIEDHGGQIAVYSRKKMGTIVRITLPFREENETDSKQNSDLPLA